MGKIIDFFKKHPIIKTLVLMIIVFFLLIALTLYGLKLYTRHGKAVIVPEVKTMILPDALRILDSWNRRLLVAANDKPVELFFYRSTLSPPE